MTREEYIQSAEFLKLRLLGNASAGITYDLQYIGDILNVVLLDRPDITFHDKYHLFERQLNVMRLEARRLWDCASDLTQFLEPKLDEPKMFEEQKCALE